MAIRYDTHSPFIIGAYSDGAVGSVVWAPILLFISIAIWKAFSNREESDTLWFAVAVLTTGVRQFLACFFLISSLPITAYHYSLEIVPRLALVIAGLLYCNVSEFFVDRRAPLRTIALVLTVLFSTVGIARMHLF